MSKSCSSSSLLRSCCVTVKLKGAKGRPLPGVTGLFQVDADRLRLQQNRWRLALSELPPSHSEADATPEMPCMAVWAIWSSCARIRTTTICSSSIRGIHASPEEHTAMVPHDERERLENLFKGDSEAVNAFVCTPTLELGVDIGQLDAVLMRNVPPLPANYWQRGWTRGPTSPHGG